MKLGRISLLVTSILFIFGVATPVFAGTFGISPGTAQVVVEQGQDGTASFTVSQQGAEGDKKLSMVVDPNAPFEVEMDEIATIPAGQNAAVVNAVVKSADLEPGEYTANVTVTEADIEGSNDGSIPIALGISAKIQLTVVEQMTENEKRNLVQIEDLIIQEPASLQDPIIATLKIQNTGKFYERDMKLTIQLLDRAGEVVDEFIQDSFSLSGEQGQEFTGKLREYQEGKYTITAKVDFRDYETDLLKETVKISFSDDSASGVWWVMAVVALGVGGLMVYRIKKQSA